MSTTIGPIDPSTGGVVPGIPNEGGSVLPNRRTHSSPGLVVHQSTGRHVLTQVMRSHVSTAGQPQAAGHLTHNGVNEVQLVTLVGSPTGGTFTLSFDGETTSALDFDSTAAEIATALYAFTAFTPSEQEGQFGDLAIQGASPSWRIEFKGQWGRQPVGPITGDGTELTGGTDADVVVTTLTPGAGLAGVLSPLVGGHDDHIPTRREEAELFISAMPTAENNGARLVHSGTVTVPQGPVGGIDSERPLLWRGHTFSSRIPMPVD